MKERVRSAPVCRAQSGQHRVGGAVLGSGPDDRGATGRANLGQSHRSETGDGPAAGVPGIGGFSASNLWRMRAFFELYRGLEKLAPLVREIGWSHNIAIMERCSDPQEREFYLHMTRKFGWSKNVLIHQIENQSYEKSLLGKPISTRP